MENILKKLTIDEFKNNRVNIALAREKGLIRNNDITLYLYIQGLYKKALDIFVLNNTKLNYYDQLIKKSILLFEPIPDDKKNIYQKFSYMNLEYIYIRNFLHIEKLSKEYIEVFYERIMKENYDIDLQLLEIVKDTFKYVIVDDYRNGVKKEKYNTCYGNPTPENILDSNCLAIIAQFKNTDKEIDDETFLTNLESDEKFFDTVFNEIEEDIKKSINVDTKVLLKYMYDEV